MAVVGTRIYVSDDETLYKSTDGGDNWTEVTEGLTELSNKRISCTVGDQVYFTLQLMELQHQN